MTPAEYLLESNVTLDKFYGYLYFMDRAHPLGDKKGRVLHHRHVASVAAGRWVEPSEVVHHVDHNRSNNSPENLEIISSGGQHARGHVLEKFDRIGRVSVALECTACGTGYRAKRGVASKFCSLECIRHTRGYPSDSAMADMVWEMPATEIAKYYGVSSSALKKHCKNSNIHTPTRGYWSAQK